MAAMSAERAAGSTVRRRLVQVLLPIAVAAIAWLAWSHRAEVSGIVAGASLAWVAGSVLLLAIGNRSAAAAFGHVLAGAGKDQLAARAACAYQIGQVAKYVPGRIWTAVLQVGLLPRGIGPMRILLANMALALAGCAMMAGVGAAALLLTSRPLLAAIALLSGITLAAVLMRAGNAGRWSRIILRMLRRSDPMGSSPDLPGAAPWAHVFGALAGYALATMAGWAMFFSGGLGLGVEAGLHATGAGAIAWIIGLASLLPAGAGARELAFVAFPSAGMLSTGDMVGLALASRLALVVVDAVAAAAGWLEWRWRRLGDVE
jgi:hypothetical protein